MDGIIDQDIAEYAILPLWAEDRFGAHDMFREFATLRNIIQGYERNFAIEKIEENLWTAARLQHYPSGGGFFSEHRDAVLESETSRVGLKTFNQFLLLLTTKGTHFQTGGGFTYDPSGQEKISFEDYFGGGDVVIYSGLNRHGVDDVDPHE